MGLRTQGWSAALLVVALAGAGCAARGSAVVPVSDASSARAHQVRALIERGCYRCLEEAYDKASGDAVQTFETALLLAARAKELGLPYDTWLDRARAARPSGPDWPDYLAIVEA